MDIKELESFKLSDAVKFHDQLNPALWTEKGNLDTEVKEQLMTIAKDFMSEIGVSSYKVEDITISGSNAAYSYTPHSDLDLHILVDYKKLPDSDVYKELFNAKKTLYNNTHDIKVRGVPVELYVQDSNQPHTSLGEYSLLKNEWNKFPVKRRANLDQAETRLKYEKLGELIELALKKRNLADIERVLDIIKRYRKAGLTKTGEFGPENLAFKAIRKQGLFQKLWDMKQELHSERLSLANEMGEDYDPNGPPPGPEFKPTMPQGTVRVDVSDVYDWYKLGQHISNLKGLGKHDFGKGPPSTILSFGDEDLEHQYIDALKKTGLDVTDIDPALHKDKKNIKTDPTYNVNEDFEKVDGGWLHTGTGHRYNYEKDSYPIYPLPRYNTFLGYRRNDYGSFDDIIHYMYFLLTNYQTKNLEITGQEIADTLAKLGKKNSKKELALMNKKNGTNWKSWDEYFEAFREYQNEKFYNAMRNMKFSESSGYIPSEKEKNDPRFKTALTIDVKPDSIKKNAKAFGFKTSRAGIPPEAKTNGKV